MSRILRGFRRLSRGEVFAALPRVRGMIVLCAVTLEPSSAEFADMQRLDSDDLRARLGLPLGCEPVMAAVSR